MKYSEKKGIEILKYIISQGLHNKYYILKSIYFADKYHLQHYGRQVNGNNFYALEYGPVPSEMYAFIKQIQKGLIDEFSSQKYNIYCETLPDYNWLSKSDIEALNYGINEVQGLSMGAVMEKSHDTADNMTDENQLITIESIVSQFDNADLVLEYLHR